MSLLRGSEKQAVERPPDGAADLGQRIAAHDRRRAALAVARAALLACQPRRRGIHAGAAAAGSSGGAGGAPSAPRVNQEAIDAGAMHAVHTAIGCNVAILGAKLGVYALSGSSSILAESIHSLADIANQARRGRNCTWRAHG